MRVVRVVAAAITAAVAVCSLSSCVLLPSIVDEVSQNGPVNDRPVVDGPVGWTEFPSCEGGPRDDFVWVDGIPSEEIDAAGIVPECGDTWIEADGDSFVGVAEYALTDAQLDALDAALVASGWELKYDDFVAATASSPSELAGARDYYLDDETKLAIEIYNNATNPITYTAYIDFHSPATRALS